MSARPTARPRSSSARRRLATCRPTASGSSCAQRQPRDARPVPTGPGAAVPLRPGNFERSRAARLLPGRKARLVHRATSPARRAASTSRRFPAGNRRSRSRDGIRLARQADLPGRPLDRRPRRTDRGPLPATRSPAASRGRSRTRTSGRPDPLERGRAGPSRRRDGKHPRARRAHRRRDRPPRALEGARPGGLSGLISIDGDLHDAGRKAVRLRLSTAPSISDLYIVDRT